MPQSGVNYSHIFKEYYVPLQCCRGTKNMLGCTINPKVSRLEKRILTSVYNINNSAKLFFLSVEGIYNIKEDNSRHDYWFSNYTSNLFDSLSSSMCLCYKSNITDNKDNRFSQLHYYRLYSHVPSIPI